MPAFPRRVPDSLVALVDPIIEILGPLVPEADAARARDALSHLDVLSTIALGLEVVLPPHPAACDISVLMPSRRVPHFARSGHGALSSLAMSVGSSESTWWELDTSEARSPVGVFIRSECTDALSTVRGAAESDHELARAVGILESAIAPHWRGPGRLIGFFPDRQPSPVAAALLPDFDSAAVGLIEGLASWATIAVDPRSALVAHLMRELDGSAVAVGTDAEGRSSVSWEGSFWEREKAMVEGRWHPVLQPSPLWGDAARSLSALLEVQGIHMFDSLPAIRLLSGIDHIKMGPGGKVKAYVGAHILLPGQR